MSKMTLEIARQNIGRGVTYQAHEGAPVEDGIIMSVNDSYVMVSYRGNVKATRANSLVLWFINSGETGENHEYRTNTI